MANLLSLSGKNANTLPSLGSLIFSVLFSFPTYPSELITIIPKYENGYNSGRSLSIQF